MKKVDRLKFERRLAKLREDLTKNYRSSGPDSANELNDGTPDYVDFATRSYTKEFLLSLSNLERQQLQRVEDALRRARTADYGLCISCGEAISRKRLTAAPWVELCITCQEAQERGMAKGGRSFNLLADVPEAAEEE